VARPSLRRRILALLTVLVTLETAATVPLLDRWAPATGPVVEAQHDPGRCPVQHDHRICVHHQSSPAHPTSPAPSTPDASVGALTGIAPAATSAGTILLTAQAPRGSQHLQELRSGTLLWATWPEIAKTAAIYSVIGAVHWLRRERFLTISLRPEVAREKGWSVRWWHFVFYALFGVVVTSSVAIAGVLLVFTFLVIPAVIAYLFSTRPGRRRADHLQPDGQPQSEAEATAESPDPSAEDRPGKVVQPLFDGDRCDAVPGRDREPCLAVVAVGCGAKFRSAAARPGRAPLNVAYGWAARDLRGPPGRRTPGRLSFGRREVIEW